MHVHTWIAAIIGQQCNIGWMFKRFHDKSQNISRGTVAAQTYQQISKSKSALKTKYSQRHKQRIEAAQQPPQATLEMLRSDAFLYQGFVKQQVKHGEGVMMLRNGTVIIGTWQQDLLQGRAIIYTSLGCRVLAQFVQGRFNGWAIATYRQRLVKCLLFFQGHLDGEKLTFDESEGMWVSAKCAYDGKLLAITHVQKGSLAELPSFLQSQELRRLLSRYIVNREHFTQFAVIEQVDGNGNSAYLGFIDEERRPCGLGVIRTENEIYAGNFFEGTLQLYGRMLFENGEVYHGEMMAGVFWGKGVYYSPTRNLTHILTTDEQEQRVERELQGYYMIDIVPNLGGPCPNNNIGIKGSTLRLIEESFEPYYRKEFTRNSKDKLDQSNNSDYGRSEEMSGDFKQCKDVKNDKLVKDLVTGSLSPGKLMKPPEKWLKFGEDEQQNIGYKRTYSLDKREAAAMRRQSVDVRPRVTEYQSIQIKENMHKEEAQDFQKQNPPQTKIMQEIVFNPDGFKLNKDAKSLQLQNVNLRNNTLQSMPDQRTKPSDLMSKVSEKSQSESSAFSGNSQQLMNLLEKNKGYRKRIFY